jgi:DNA-binding NarL/FixJ family response regulator
VPDSQTSVYIIEDSELTRAVLRESLNQSGDIKVVGEAGDGESAVREVAELRPSVVLIDIGLPGLDGIEVTKRIKEKLPSTRAIVLTAQRSDDSMFEAFTAGAEAYLIKDDFSPEKLHDAISDVKAGSGWLDPEIAKQILNSVAASETEKTGLSDEEKRVLKLVAEHSVPLSQQKPGSGQNVLDRIESEKTGGQTWSSFMNKLQRFKE